MLAVAAACLAPSAARADGLTAAEQARLQAGQTITREQTVEDGERRFVGGVTYTIVDASVEEVLGLFDDPSAYRQLLPRTRDARLVAGPTHDTYVQLEQGNGVMSASYVLRVRKYSRESTVRFWLDRSFPHAIDDAWGFFRAEPLAPSPSGAPRVLLTYGALVDPGPGIVRAFYEERLRAAVLSVPRLVERYVLENLRHTSEHPA